MANNTANDDNTTKHRRRGVSCDSCNPPLVASPGNSKPLRQHNQQKHSAVSSSFALSSVELVVFGLLLYASIALISGWPLLPPLLLPPPEYLPYNQWEDGVVGGVNIYNNNPAGSSSEYQSVGAGSQQEPQLRFSACEIPSSPSGDRMFSLCFGHAVCSLAESSWVDSPAILQLDIAQQRMDQLMSAVSQQIKEEVGYGNHDAILSRLLSIPLVCDRMVLTSEELITANDRREMLINTRQVDNNNNGGSIRPAAPQGVMLGGGRSGGEIYSGSSRGPQQRQ
eukprot:GHVS01033911.1.p1 GENE.GHVS01033911.1~~GHVS01033911.1.p1  ORF type:complete len:281 (-),score=73.02 GHVS01033911.1:74-916(-)